MKGLKIPKRVPAFTPAMVERIRRRVAKRWPIIKPTWRDLMQELP